MRRRKQRKEIMKKVKVDEEEGGRRGTREEPVGCPR